MTGFLTWTADPFRLATWSMRLASLNQSTATSSIRYLPAGTCKSNNKILNTWLTVNLKKEGGERNQLCHLNAWTFDLSCGKFLLRTLKILLSGTAQQLQLFSFVSWRIMPENQDKSIGSEGPSNTMAKGSGLSHDLATYKSHQSNYKNGVWIKNNLSS